MISQFGIWRHGISAPAAPVRQVAGAASRRVLIDLASGRVQCVSTELAWACRGVPICRVLPHSAAPRIRLISLTAIRIGVYSYSRSRAHNPEVVGSNPAPAIHGNPIAASRLGLAVFVRRGVEIPARGVSELAGACRCAGRASTVASGGATSRDCRVERGTGSADRRNSRRGTLAGERSSSQRARHADRQTDRAWLSIEQ